MEHTDNTEAMLASLRAIRAIENISCAELCQLFDAIGAKMTERGFSRLDMDALDDCAGFICKEVTA
jgi:hypothetical protein